MVFRIVAVIKFLTYYKNCISDHVRLFPTTKVFDNIKLLSNLPSHASKALILLVFSVDGTHCREQ